MKGLLSHQEGVHGQTRLKCQHCQFLGSHQELKVNIEGSNTKTKLKDLRLRVVLYFLLVSLKTSNFYYVLIY